jgi:hypothetical protein
VEGVSLVTITVLPLPKVSRSRIDGLIKTLKERNSTLARVSAFHPLLPGSPGFHYHRAKR